MRVAAVLLVLAASAAFAGDGDGVADAVRAALAKGDRAAALAILQGVTRPDAPRDRRRSVEAARAAMDLVGGPEGDLAAARILVDTLAADKSDSEGALSVAMGLRRRVADVDLPAALELSRGLVRIYPDAVAHSYDLAGACLHSGLPEEALAAYGRIVALEPSVRDVRYRLALLHKDRGELPTAVAVYDELIRLGEADGRPDLRAHLYKSWLLLRDMHDCAAARSALDAGVAAAAASPDRDAYLPQFNELRSVVDDEEQRRRDLRAMRGRVDGALWAVGAVWALVLGGGLALLRRAKWV